MAQQNEGRRAPDSGEDDAVRREQPDLKNMTLAELTAWVEKAGLPAFRARQIFSWIARGSTTFASMTNLPKELREQLETQARLGSLQIEIMQKSEDGTRKFLFRLPDSSGIEAVFLRYHYGNSICLSSQVGCAMGCAFCASTIGGCRRNLTAGEMYDQLLCAERVTGESIRHIVIMGTGEPLANYNELLRLLDIVHEPEGLGIGLRNITVSTCGLVPEIERFTEDLPQVNLAISLHAPDNELRDRLMPVNRRYPLEQLMPACRRYVEHTGRRITFEYALIAGLNDSRRMIHALAELLHDSLPAGLCHVNLIPLNKVTEARLTGSSRQRAASIASWLEEQGIAATVRRELGGDIDAACGQLRRKNNI
ncbi:MAG: 23S rRNA (adenine(2503)-C(2))-methyltransferase RlmN [Anaerovoracaceae bacterium]